MSAQHEDQVVYYDEVPVCSLINLFLDEIRTVLCFFRNTTESRCLDDLIGYLYEEIPLPDVAASALFALGSGFTASVVNRCMGTLLSVRNQNQSIILKTGISARDLEALRSGNHPHLSNEFCNSVFDARDELRNVFLEVTGRKTQSSEDVRPLISPLIAPRQDFGLKELQNALLNVINSGKDRKKAPKPASRRPLSLPDSEESSPEPEERRSESSEDPEDTDAYTPEPPTLHFNASKPPPPPGIPFKIHKIPGSLDVSPVAPSLHQNPPPKAPARLTPENLRAIDRISAQVAANLQMKTATSSGSSTPSESVDVYRISLLPPPGLEERFGGATSSASDDSRGSSSRSLAPKFGPVHTEELCESHWFQKVMDRWYAADWAEGVCQICRQLIYQAHETVTCVFCEETFHYKCQEDRSARHSRCISCGRH